MEVRIEKLVYGGEGLAHHEGQTVFVPLVLPGELVSIESASRGKKIVRGRLLNVVEPSPERVPGPCPHFGHCGGCQYQHMPYDAQLRYKAEILRETLRRLGRVLWGGPIETHPSPPFEYRNRAQWKVRRAQAGQGLGDAKPLPADAPCPADISEAATIGYFEAGSTRLCAVQQCPILSPRLAQTLAALRALAASPPSSPTAPWFAQIDEIEAFADSADDRILLNVSGERFTIPLLDVIAALREAIPFAESVLVQERRSERFELGGPGYIFCSVRGASYRVGHLSFFQVNRFLIKSLIDGVLGDTHGGLALDLFAGVGLFTVPLAARFDRVIGVESNLAAVKDLEFNLQATEGTSPVARHATAEKFLERWRDTPDLVVLDPPRAGVDPAALARLKKLAPASLHYLSCDPATLARDLAFLLGDKNKPGPYEIAAINLFDIFPQTYHMEALVRLKRRA